MMFHDVSWCFMMFHDVSWCFMMFHDVSWCFMMFHDVSWCFMMFHDVSWCFMMFHVFHDVSWCFMMFHDVSWCFMMFHDVSWCFMMFHVFHDVSWWFLNFHDVSWCFMMFHDVSWCFMMFHDVSWCFMMFHDVSWWFMMVHDGSWCFMMFHDVSWCFMMFHDVSWCFMMFHDVSWCFMMFHDGSWWFMMVHDVSWCFMMFHDVSWCFMMFHDVSWCFMMVHDGSWWFMMFHDVSWCFMMFHVASLVVLWGRTEKMIWFLVDLDHRRFVTCTSQCSKPLSCGRDMVFACVCYVPRTHGGIRARKLLEIDSDIHGVVPTRLRIVSTCFNMFQHVSTCFNMFQHAWRLAGQDKHHGFSCRLPCNSTHLWKFFHHPRHANEVCRRSIEVWCPALQCSARIGGDLEHLCISLWVLKTLNLAKFGPSNLCERNYYVSVTKLPCLQGTNGKSPFCTALISHWRSSHDSAWNGGLECCCKGRILMNFQYSERCWFVLLTISQIPPWVSEEERGVCFWVESWWYWNWFSSCQTNPTNNWTS